MSIEHVPLLQLQRELLDTPRGTERFKAYIRLVTGEGGDDIALPPLVIVNPMGREHVAAQLDALLALDAEAVAANAVAAAVAALPALGGGNSLRHGLALADDLRGGWTDRPSVEAAQYFSSHMLDGLKRGWIATTLWVTDPSSAAAVRATVLATLRRIAYLRAHGPPTTLAAALRQEGVVGRFAGLAPHLDDEELRYSHEVIAPHLASEDYAVWIAALFGDVAASNLGYPALGLAPRAGFAVALGFEAAG